MRKKHAHLEKREGGEKDEEELSILFSTLLKYRVVLLKNLKGSQIGNALSVVTGQMLFNQLSEEDKIQLAALELKENLVSADHDSFICCMLDVTWRK